MKGGFRADRADVHRGVEQLHVLRNRGADHEPVHRRDLQAHFDIMMTLASLICPDSVSTGCHACTAGDPPTS